MQMEEIFFLLAKVESNEEPPSASRIFCPLINILTGPEVVNFDFAYNRSATTVRLNKRKMVMLAIMVVVSNSNIIRTIERLQFYAHKTHECYPHKSGYDERDTKAT